MNKHLIYISFTFYSIILIFGVSITYSDLYKDNNIKFEKIIGKNIFFDSKDLKKTIVIFSSESDISNFKINSSCKTKTDFLYKIENKSYFLLDFLDKCNNFGFYLNDGNKNIYKTYFELKLYSDFDIYDNYLNFKNDKLSFIDNKLQVLREKYKLNIASINEELFLTPEMIKKNRIFNEIEYNKNIISEIINKRTQKYIVPVRGKFLPDGKNKSKLPNSSRPYRADYTNAVHEGWDIDADFDTEVIAIDDGIIVRVIDDFKFEDLKNIEKGINISYEQKVKNLDILRGNQVWLKTMKGDIIFYGHLNKVFDEIKYGTIVKKGQKLGTIGISGVPDKNYKDYHLHFELRQNNYKDKNNIYDYMTRDWYFKNNDYNYIIENQYNIFEK